MMKRATRIDQTLGALDDAGVHLWGRQKAPDRLPDGWYWASPDAVRNLTTAGVKQGKAPPVDGIYGPFSTAAIAAGHALHTMGLSVVVH